METIQLTSQNQENINELILIMGGIETQLKQIAKTLDQLNKNIAGIGIEYRENNY